MPLVAQILAALRAELLRGWFRSTARGRRYGLPRYREPPLAPLYQRGARRSPATRSRGESLLKRAKYSVDTTRARSYRIDSIGRIIKSPRSPTSNDSDPSTPRRGNGRSSRSRPHNRASQPRADPDQNDSADSAPARQALPSSRHQAGRDLGDAAQGGLGIRVSPEAGTVKLPIELIRARCLLAERRRVLEDADRRSGDNQDAAPALVEAGQSAEDIAARCELKKRNISIFARACGLASLSSLTWKPSSGSQARRFNALSSIAAKPNGGSAGTVFSTKVHSPEMRFSRPRCVLLDLLPNQRCLRKIRRIGSSDECENCQTSTAHLREHEESYDRLLGKAQQRGLEVNDAQSTNFPYTSGGYPPSTEKKEVAKAPTQMIENWGRNLPEDPQELQDNIEEVSEPEETMTTATRAVQIHESYSARPPARGQ